MRLTPRQRASWLAHLFKAATQQHHGELRAVFAPHVGRSSIVVDIGAHAGQFSKLFARMAPLGHVYAFEPAEYARSVMAPALRLSGLKNVTLIAKGLSDTPGEMTLHTPIKRSGSMGFGIAHLGRREEAGPTVDQIVEVTTLDAFAEGQGLTRLDFIKADVEGWELRALAGGEGCLRRFAPALFLEVDAPFLARAGGTPGALFDWLASLGYGAVRIPSLIPAPAYAGAGDYLFTHAEKP